MMFEQWAESQLAGLEKDARSWEQTPSVQRRLRAKQEFVRFVLDAYRSEGSLSAMDWCEWAERHAATLSDAWLAESCARIISEEV